MKTYIFTKDGSLERPKNISKTVFNAAEYGTEFEFTTNDNRYTVYHFSGSSDYSSINYNKLKSLKNTINYYSGFDDIFNYNNFYNTPITLVCLNSLYFGSSIPKGTVRLEINISGSTIDYATDSKENGVLSSSLNGKIGIVLYKEGFILLNNQAAVTSSYIQFNRALEKPSWINFLALSTGSINPTVEYGYENKVETNIIMIPAEKNKLNHSNNNTYISSGSYSVSYNSSSFVEQPNLVIKNTVKSDFVSASATFEKETYITKIGLYDKDKNLIGISSLANPVRKTENREYIFKIKLDI